MVSVVHPATLHAKECTSKRIRPLPLEMHCFSTSIARSGFFVVNIAGVLSLFNVVSLKIKGLSLNCATRNQVRLNLLRAENRTFQHYAVLL